MKKQILRKTVCALLACALVCASVFPAFAGTPAEDAHLHFNADGRFRILNFSDIQDDETLDSRVKSFIRRAVVDARPDLIALTGDNIYGPDASGTSNTRTAIAEFMTFFQQLGVPVAIVFGNHDDDDNGVTKEEQMQMYSSYSVNISYDEGSSMAGCGTYNVPIYGSSDRSKVKFNLWMFDTGSSINSALSSKYDYMRADQLQWYVSKSNELKASNGGVPVPSIAFQHIIVNDIYDALREVSSGGVSYNGKRYVLPDTAAPGSVLGEHPCPSDNENETEFSVLKQQGDVIAIVSGHDHKNMFVVPHQGIDLINSPAAGFYQTVVFGHVFYEGDDATRGARIIDVDETTGTYTTSMLFLRELAKSQYYTPTSTVLNTLSLREACFNAVKLLKDPPAIYSTISYDALQEAIEQADVILHDLDADNSTTVYDQTALDQAAQQVRACMQALLTPAFTVTFDANGGIGAVQRCTFIYGAAVGTLPNALRESYLLDGWYTERTGGEKITSETIFTATSDQTWYAHWVRDPNWRIPGDVDQNKVVDLRDIVLVQRYLVNDLTYSIKIPNADVDGSGTVNLRDVMLMRRYVAGGWGVVLI